MNAPDPFKQGPSLHLRGTGVFEVSEEIWQMVSAPTRARVEALLRAVETLEATAERQELSGNFSYADVAWEKAAVLFERAESMLVELTTEHGDHGPTVDDEAEAPYFPALEEQLLDLAVRCFAGSGYDSAFKLDHGPSGLMGTELEHWLRTVYAEGDILEDAKGRKYYRRPCPVSSKLLPPSMVGCPDWEIHGAKRVVHSVWRGPSGRRYGPAEAVAAGLRPLDAWGRRSLIRRAMVLGAACTSATRHDPRRISAVACEELLLDLWERHQGYIFELRVGRGKLSPTNLSLDSLQAKNLCLTEDA